MSCFIFVFIKLLRCGIALEIKVSGILYYAVDLGATMPRMRGAPVGGSSLAFTSRLRVSHASSSPA